MKRRILPDSAAQEELHRPREHDKDLALYCSEVQYPKADNLMKSNAIDEIRNATAYSNGDCPRVGIGVIPK